MLRPTTPHDSDIRHTPRIACISAKWTRLSASGRLGAMALSFRHRVFLGLAGLGTLPLAVALVVLALLVQSTRSPTGRRAALDEIAQSGRQTIAALDTTRLGEDQQAALRQHTETIAQQTSMARRAETLTNAAAGILGLAILLVAVVLVAASLFLARRWSAYTSAPIEQLVNWVRRIERREPLPATAKSRGPPEFDALRHAVREMSEALEHARHQELEQERLRAFRETARRVAHEMRSPLTSAQLALRQLRKAEDTAGDTATVALQVLGDETERLRRMAQEFAEFGRLPEGPEAPVDVGELVENVVGSTVPEDYPVRRRIGGGLVIRGHYEALRRALQNVVRNAVEVTDAEGIEITAERDEPNGSSVRVTIADHGPGVPPEDRDRIFEPYFTTKKLGTGLGLALVRQTVLAHGGTIAVEDSPWGGAAFVLTFQES